MTDLNPQPNWSSVRQLEVSEYASGGANGNMNEQAKALAARTELLKQQNLNSKYQFNTYAEFDAVKSTLPVSCTVVIGEENNTGTGSWGIGNNKWNGTTLTKSAYDPVAIAAEYTTTKANAAQAAAIAESSTYSNNKLNEAKEYTETEIAKRISITSTREYPVVIKDIETGQGVPILNQKGQLVGELTGAVNGPAKEVSGGDFEIKTMLGRRDALLVARDATTGQGVVIVDAMGNVGNSVQGNSEFTTKPINYDRVLSDMVENGNWRGDWSALKDYNALDVVSRSGKYYVCFSSITANSLTPDLDSSHWEYLPLVTNQGFILEDSFRLNAGPANNRNIQPNQQWKLSGAGFSNGIVTNEYMTSAENTYYFLVNFTQKITEISTIERFFGIGSVEGNHTLAISYMENWNTVSGFQNMWHINWGTNGIGSVTYWKGSSTANSWTTGKIKISKGLKADKDGVAYKHTAKLRGNFIFGYLDDELAYIHCDELIGEMTANAKAFYVQNHWPNLGQERIEKVIVKSGVLS